MITGDQRDHIVETVDEWGIRRWWHAWCVQAAPTEHSGPVAEAAADMWTARFQWLALLAWHVAEGRLSSVDAGEFVGLVEVWGAVRAESARIACHPGIPLYVERAADATVPGLRADWRNLLDRHTHHPEPPLSTKPTALQLPPGSG